MHKSIFRRLAAYIYMPLIFILTGVLAVGISFGPQIKNVYNIFSMVSGDHDVERETELTVIFDEEKAAENAGADSFTLADFDYPSEGEQFGILTCDAIDLSVPLFMGDSLDILEYAAGMNTLSYLPGFGCTILIGGHNYSLFLPLRNVKEGDVFTVRTNYGTFQYQVDEIKIGESDDYSAYKISHDKETLLLYTCYPFEVSLLPKHQMMYVYADKILGPSLIREESAN